jgi:Tfp pilus assembly protein PilO
MNPFHKRIAVNLSIALGIIAVLVLGVVIFGFRINSLSEKIAATRHELNERSTALSSLASLRSEYSTKGQPYLNVLYNVIPQKDELIDLSKDFQAIAQENGLNYGFIFLGENPPSGGTLGSVNFSLSLGGELADLLSFLKNLENFRYLISLDNVSIAREPDLMRMNIRGSVFYR